MIFLADSSTNKFKPTLGKHCIGIVLIILPFYFQAETCAEAIGDEVKETDVCCEAVAAFSKQSGQKHKQ